MSYTKNPKFIDGETLHAADLVAMEDAILANDKDYYDLSKEFRAMVQPGWIEYGSGATAGTAANISNSTTSVTPSRCGIGHAIYLCNRTFIFSNSEKYEMVIVKMDANLTILENTGWIKGTYTINKNECAWFSIILKSADLSSVANNLNDVVKDLKVIVSKENIDKKSDFPLVLGIMNFTDTGVMSSKNSTFTTYSAFNTLTLTYPIIGERMIEQSIRDSSWYQSLATYDSTSGARMQKLGFFTSMTWVDTLKNENFFPQWRKANGGTITYYEALSICESISIKRVDNKSNKTWVMEKDTPFRSSSHRIDAQLAPRNTYAALEFAYNRGRRWFESDIRWTSDMVPVMLHDDGISSVSNGSGSISKMTYEQVSQYDFGGYHSPRFKGEKILKLEDMMRFAKEYNCGLNLEFKNPQTAEVAGIVWNMVKKYGLEKQVMFNINGINDTFIKAILALDETIELQILPGSSSPATSDKIAAYLNGKNTIHTCVDWSLWTQEYVDYAISKGLKVDAHCVSSQDTITPEKYRQMIDWGLSGIITESANTDFYSKEILAKH